MAKSVRLTKTIREQIEAEIIRNAFHERGLAQMQTEIDFANEVFETIFKNSLDLLNNAPSGFFPESHLFLVRMGDGHYMDCLSISWGFGSDRRRGFHRAAGISPTQEKRPMPYNIAQRGHAAAVFDERDKIVKRYRKIEAAHYKLNEEFTDARRNVNALLGSVTTVQKLIEVWPECEDIAKQWLVETKPSTAIAIPMADLNAKLGLPPEKVAA